MARVNKMIFIHRVSGIFSDVLTAHVHIAMTMKIRFIGQPY
jgi:hypothetical protein